MLAVFGWLGLVAIVGTINLVWLVIAGHAMGFGFNDGDGFSIVDKIFLAASGAFIGYIWSLVLAAAPFHITLG